MKRFLFGDALPRGTREALQRWRTAPPADPHTALAEARFLVLDPAVTGVDLGRDRLTGLGLIVVQNAAIHLDTLQLIPVIDDEVRQDGAFATLLAAIGPGPLVTYHAAFVDTMLGRTLPGWAEVLARGIPRIDLARLLNRYFAADSTAPIPLGRWLERFGIAQIREHDARCDAYAMAQLLLVAIAQAEAQGVQSVGQLAAAARPPATPLA